MSERTRGEGELSQCGHFADKGGGGSIFCDFVRTSLWTALDCFNLEVMLDHWCQWWI